ASLYELGTPEVVPLTNVVVFHAELGSSGNCSVGTGIVFVSSVRAPPSADETSPCSKSADDVTWKTPSRSAALVSDAAYVAEGNCDAHHAPLGGMVSTMRS